MEREKIFLSIQNFKGLEDIDIEIKPMTLLFGTNGSGKSSLLDAISIFCNSIWGWLNNSASNKEFVENLDFDSLVNSRNKSKGSFTVGWMHQNNFNFQITYGKINGRTGIDSIFCEKFENGIKIWSFTVNPDMIYKVKGKLDDRLFDFFEAMVNETFNARDLKKHVLEDRKNVLEKIESQLTLSEEIIDELNQDTLILLECFINTGLYKIFHPKETTPLAERTGILYGLAIMSLTVGIDRVLKLSGEEINKSFKSAKSILDEFNDVLTELLTSLASFQKMEDVRKNPPDYFECISEKIVNDYFGLCQFLLDLEIESLSTRTERKKKEAYEMLIHLLKEFELADGIKIEKIGERKPDISYYQIFFTSGKQSFPLKNLSSGGKQILPIIMMLVLDEPSYFTMRQPELHLHPKLQTKIPEILIDFYKQAEEGI